MKGQIAELQAKAGANARDHGFWESIGKLGPRDVDIAVRLALLASEVGEAIEAHRDPNSKHDIQEELADIVIRVLDMADYLGFDLEQAVLDKMERNAARPRLHGGKLY